MCLSRVLWKIKYRTSVLVAAHLYLMQAGVAFAPSRFDRPFHVVRSIIVYRVRLDVFFHPNGVGEMSVLGKTVG
jgi:hypothetical protein